MALSQGDLYSSTKWEGQKSLWVKTIPKSFCERGEICVEGFEWDRDRRISRVEDVGEV